MTPTSARGGLEVLLVEEHQYKYNGIKPVAEKQYELDALSYNLHCYYSGSNLAISIHLRGHTEKTVLPAILVLQNCY